MIAKISQLANDRQGSLLLTPENWNSYKWKTLHLLISVQRQRKSELLLPYTQLTLHKSSVSNFIILFHKFLTCDSPCWVDPITFGSVLIIPGQSMFLLNLLPCLLTLQLKLKLFHTTLRLRHTPSPSWFSNLHISLVLIAGWKGFNFSSVQLLSHVWLFATPWTAACQASLSITNSWVYSNSCPLNSWCHPTISSSVVPFSSCRQSFPASGSKNSKDFFFSFLFPCQSKQNTLPYRKTCPFHNCKNIPFFQRREGWFHKQNARTFLIIEFENHFLLLKTCTWVPNGTQNMCNCTQMITLKSITNQTDW